MELFNYFTSELPGAPALTPTPGSLIEVLDTVLVNGMGLTVVNQIVVAAGMATIEVSGVPVALEAGLIELAGLPSSHDSLNGVHRVESIGAGSVTIAVSAADATLAAPGMTMRIPPLGWQILASDTHQRIYQSSSPRTNGYCLYVDDRGTNTAAVYGCTSASTIVGGVANLVGRFPDVSNVNWMKSIVINAAARQWMVAGDDRAAYVGIALYSDGSTNQHARNYSWCALVESANTAPGDVHNTALFSSGGTSFSQGLSVLGEKGKAVLDMPKRANGEVLSEGVKLYCPPSVVGTTGVMQQFSGNAASDVASGRMWLCRVGLFAHGEYRGDLPGWRFVPHWANRNNVPTLWNAVATHVDGRRVLMVPATTQPGQMGGLAAFAIDEWRA